MSQKQDSYTEIYIFKRPRFDVSQKIATFAGAIIQNATARNGAARHKKCNVEMQKTTHWLKHFAALDVLYMEISMGFSLSLSEMKGTGKCMFC